MNYDPLVSIIITTYKRAENLERAIVSVLEQQYKNIEIIVVDDNGYATDFQKETRLRIESYIISDQIIYIAREKNGGGGSARNTGIEYAKGELITFLDDDDEYLNDKVLKQVNYIKMGYDICLCSMVVRKENGVTISPNWAIARGNSIKEFILHGLSYTPMIMAKSSVIRKAGGFDAVPMLQDHVFMLKLLEFSPKLIAIKDKLYIHNIHTNERVSKKKDLNSYLIKQEMERSFCFLLNKKENKYLEFKHNKELSLLFSEKGYRQKSIAYLLKACIKYTGEVSFIEIIKLFIRIALGPKGYALIESLREK